MFSRYKKPAPTKVPAGAAPLQAVPQAAPKPAPEARAMAAAQRKPSPQAAAMAMAADKDRKRKEKMSEMKVELHKRLLENLNLAALETARDRWRYRPGTRNGVPEAMWYRVPINFTLDQ